MHQFMILQYIIGREKTLPRKLRECTPDDMFVAYDLGTEYEKIQHWEDAGRLYSRAMGMALANCDPFEGKKELVHRILRGIDRCDKTINALK